LSGHSSLHPLCRDVAGATMSCGMSVSQYSAKLSLFLQGTTLLTFIRAVRKVPSGFREYADTHILLLQHLRENDVKSQFDRSAYPT